MKLDSYDEKRLTDWLKEGREDAFTALYNHYWKTLYFLAYKHLKSPQLSEEVVQEVFLSLWRYRSNLQVESFHTYLAAMTRYTVYRIIAKERRMAVTGIGDTREYVGPDNTEDFINHKLLLDIIQNLSNRLPEKCRLVFTCNKLLDQPLEQVAKEMDISVKTAEAHLTKALKIIRGGLKDASFLFLVI